MVLERKVVGYENFRKTLEELAANKKSVNIYFEGLKDERGQSWCPDCNVADPHVQKALDQHKEKDFVFLVVEVGDRAFWKDSNNPFRKDKDTHLSVVPSLLRWQSPKRLEGEQLYKDELLDMFFEDDD